MNHRLSLCAIPTARQPSRWRASASALLLGFLLGFGACRQPAVTQPGAEAAPADLVLTGAVIHTMDPAQPRAEAIAIREGRIIHVGSRDSIQGFIGTGTTVHQLAGRAVLPGLHDSHNHLAWSATELEDVVLTQAKTIDDLRARITAHAAKLPNEPWIRGSGWDNSTFEGKLHKSQLDAIEPNRPVYMVAADGHSAWVNSAALAQANITAQTPDPELGRIERDPTGEPTGMLREEAMGLVSKRMPPYSQTQIDIGLTKGLQEASSYGITSIIDPSAKPWVLDAYQRFAHRGMLTIRVNAAIEVDPTKDIKQQLASITAARARYRAPMLRVNAIKLFIDGVIESKTAYMLAPYSDGTNGIKRFTDQALTEIVIAFDKAGFQLHAHAIGDAAVRQMLNAIEQARAANGPADRRPLLAHLQVIDPADIPRFGKLDAIAVFSPLWAYPDPAITELTVPVIGPERSEWLYPMGAVHAAGGVLAGSSDWSVSSMDPFDAMEVAVTRQASESTSENSNDAPVLTPQHRVSLQTILEAYTMGGARAAFAEHELGSITVGKRADVVVLDRDPFAIPAHELSELQALMTFVDGREVYRARNRAGASEQP